jgi:hypothetical protein
MVGLVRALSKFRALQRAAVRFVDAKLSQLCSLFDFIRSIQRSSSTCVTRLWDLSRSWLFEVRRQSGDEYFPLDAGCACQSDRRRAGWPRTSSWNASGV